MGTPRGKPLWSVSLPTAQLVPRKCFPSEINDLTRDQALKEVSRIILTPNCIQWGQRWEDSKGLKGLGNKSSHLH